MNVLQLDNAISDCLTTLHRNTSNSARVETPVAKKMLLDNTTFHDSAGRKRYLRFQNLGLGVYEVTVADLDSVAKNLILKGKK